MQQQQQGSRDCKAGKIVGGETEGVQVYTGREGRAQCSILVRGGQRDPHVAVCSHAGGVGRILREAPVLLAEALCWGWVPCPGAGAVPRWPLVAGWGNVGLLGRALCGWWPVKLVACAPMARGQGTERECGGRDQ